MTPSVTGVHIGQRPLQALAAWARERYGLRWPLRAQVLKFIRNYQDAPGDPRPFVGRAETLGLLDQWLLQGQSRFKLLSGDAGRGKSALLLNWMDRLVQGGDGLTLWYLPISIRFNTAGETAGLQLLFAALCDTFDGLKGALPERPESEDYVVGIASAWKQQADQTERRFLLVIDGLDEAANQWLLKRPLLPPQIPPNLHVLISARHKPGHATGAGWLDDLQIGLRDTPANSVILELDALDRDALAEAMIRLGAPLDGLAERQAFLDELYRLTDQGDPLLLTLWLGQIWRNRDGLPDLDSTGLERLQPSFLGFYRSWLADQQAVWAAWSSQQGQPAVDLVDFEKLMHVLAMAQGPLLLSDLVDVLGHLDGAVPWERDRLQQVLETAHRVVVGDGAVQGYVFVHPRLAQHFQEKAEADPALRSAVRAAFVRWGAATVRRLNCSELAPEDCPRYLLTHYVAVHIDAVDEQDRSALERYHLPLLAHGWPDAWYANDGAWQGYLDDLDRIRRRLNAYNRECMRTGRTGDALLGAEVRCALMATTVRSLISGFSLSIETLVREGIWSLARAGRVARECDIPAKSLAGVAALAREMGDIGQARLWVEEALEAAAAIQEEGTRVWALGNITAQLKGEAGLLQQALALAAAFDDEGLRADALSSVAAQLEGDAKHAVLHQAQTAAGNVPEPGRRVRALTAVAANLEGVSRHRALTQALNAATAIKGDAAGDAVVAAPDHIDPTDLGKRLSDLALLDALRRLVPLLAGDRGLLQQALTASAALQDDRARMLILREIAPHLEGESRQATLGQLLAYAATLEHDSQVRANTLISILDEVQKESRPSVLRDALEAATAIENLLSRAGALSELAARLDGESKQAVLQQALAAASALDDGRRADTLIRIADQLEGESRHRVLRQALEAVTDPEDEWMRHNGQGRVITLNAIADRLEGDSRLEALQHALAAAMTVDHRGSRAQALQYVAQRLEGDARSALLQQALEEGTILGDARACADALTAIGALLQGEPAQRVLQHAHAAAAAIPEEVGPFSSTEGTRAAVLTRLAAQLPVESRQKVLQEALASAAGIPDQYSRASALAAIAAWMEGEPRNAVLQQALAAAATTKPQRHPFGDDAWRAAALCDIAGALPGESRHALLQQAFTITDVTNGINSRAYALERIAGELTGDSDLLRQVLAAARTLRHEEDRVRVLGRLVAKLPADLGHQLLPQVLTDAAAIEDGSLRANALSGVAALLPEGQRHAVLRDALTAAASAVRMAIEHRRDGEYAPMLEALGDVVVRLQGDHELLAAALEEALSLPRWCKDRISLYATIARLQPQLLTYEGWSDLLAQARLRRPQLLSVTGDLARCAIQLTGREEDAAQIAQAVHEICRWKP
jgi:hypothetical protein